MCNHALADLEHVINVAVEMLITGQDLYVNKNDFTPAKINAKQGAYFSRNDTLLDQHVDLSWTSRKGFRLGIVFTGYTRDFNLQDNFPPNANVYIAAFNVDVLSQAILAQQLKVDSVGIQTVLASRNEFSSWVYWPQHPQMNAGYSPCQKTPPIHDNQSTSSAYEEWLLSLQDLTQTSATMNSNTSGIRSIYSGCKRLKSTGETVFRFRVSIAGSTEYFHLVTYAGEVYLLDYAYDSVPFDAPLRREILLACQRQMPTTD